LKTENIINNEFYSKTAYVVGNTGLDNLLQYKDKCEYGNTVLIEMHRRENENKFKDYFIEIEKLANKFKNLSFIFPMHPNPIVQKHKNVFKTVNIIEPLDHNKFLEELIKCKIVITDSGGLQEECSFFNKRCIVCRTFTERPESVGNSTLLCIDARNLQEQFEYCNNFYNINYECPYGDGKSAEKIYNILSKICQ
jgi:UDP-N-acetylglucosamine 2-epimerase (non-hydrolysing)